MPTSDKSPWRQPMPEEQFAFMREILSAPSPVSFEGAMTFGVLEPYMSKHGLDGWKAHRFRSNASLVLDTAPENDDAFTVMIVGHADKIRMQVRSIGEDGKIWINSDSFLPCTLIGHEVKLFSERPDSPGEYRILEGGTIEAIGAIHFAEPEMRSGRKGIKPNQLYLELQVHGAKKKKQIDKLGIKPGDPILLNRPIKRGFSPDTFYGAYLDNGLGCFVVAEVARQVAARGGLRNVRYLATMATHEEIGRMGSRVLAGEFRPDVLIAVDVSHDFVAAPGIKDRNLTPIEMGKGFTLETGSITSPQVNAWVLSTCSSHDIPMQYRVVGRDTGTDAMAAVLASIDAAAISVGVPIRNMHTISECAHTGDVLAATHAMSELLFYLDAMNEGAGPRREDLTHTHPRLDRTTVIEAHGPLD